MMKRFISTKIQMKKRKKKGDYVKDLFDAMSTFLIL